jgi:AbiU2
MSRKRKWRRWIRVIDQEILDSIREDKLVFDRYYALLKSNAAISTPWNFHQWVLQNHGRSLMLQVRKLADRDTRSYSLRKLMEQIRDNPEFITRRSFVTAFPKHHRDIAVTNWIKYAGGARVLELPSTVPEKDIKLLERITKRVCILVNKDIAHLDRCRRQRTTDFDELYKLLRRLVSLAGKYGNLLGYDVADDLDNFTIPYDWMSIFDLPWRLSTSNKSFKARHRNAARP